MSKQTEKLRDPGAERAILGTIMRGGRDALIDAETLVDANDFSLPINRAVYSCLKSLGEDQNCEIFDVETIKMKAKTLGLSEYISGKKELEYLELLDDVSFDQGNIPVFGMQIKKYSVVRDLYSRYESAISYLDGVTGNETLSDIIRTSESKIVDYISGADDGDSLKYIGDDLVEKVEQLIESEPVDQIGYDVGFPLWARGVGGGPRPGTITFWGARAKTGKSFHAINIARNAAKRGVKVLLLDTELVKMYQQHRLLSMESGCPISLLETGRFNASKDYIESVREAAKTISEMPLYYKSIAGMSHIEALSYCRRWIMKEVGLDENGMANPCIIAYDYLKISDNTQITHNIAEWMALGFLMSDLHNFAVKYNVAICAWGQLNREGLDNDSAGVIAGSDRIMWLASSVSILRNKNENDIELGSSWDHGNKKMSIIETRQGPGLEYENDYINMKTLLKPRVSSDVATGLMTEGFTFSQLAGKNSEN